jgi:hypothetical protein
MKSILCLFVLLVLLSTAGFASAADGDITRVSPDQNISISEGDSQVFSISIANTDPANLTYTIKWYVDGVEKQSTTTNSTSNSYTFDTGSSDAGTRTVNATSTGGTATPVSWTVTIANKLFLAVGEVISATVGIVPGIVNLIIGIVPIIITLSLVSLLTGIFGAIIYAIRKGI